jgi:superfamily II DNA helicase RecQ
MERVLRGSLAEIFGELAPRYFGAPPPLPLPAALRQPTDIIVHPSRLKDLREFLGDPLATFRSAEQAELLEKMQSRRNHVLAILQAGQGKTFLTMMQAKMYYSRVTTLVILPLSGLHNDYVRRAKAHNVTISRWLPNSKFNPDASIIYVSVEHAGLVEFQKYVSAIVCECQIDAIV